MKKTIYEGNVGLLWRKGSYIKTLSNGRHRYSFFRNERIEIIPILPVDLVQVPTEYSTKDNLLIRIPLNVVYEITDVLKMRKNILYENLEMRIHTILSDAVRSVVSGFTLDELLNEATKLHEIINKKSHEALDGIGVKLNSVSPVDLLIPRSLRQAFEAELAARKRAVADLEEARGRTAVLRHLNNAADLVDKRPVLLKLLLGQKARYVQFQFDEQDKKK